MDIKKGISYIAFGFLFTLLNINLTLNGSSINIMPDFVGWILMFLAFDHLGHYVENKAYLKWVALILAILTGIIWVYGLIKPDLNIDIVKMVVSFVSVVFMFILFGVLEEVARDKAPIYAKNISMLKIVNLVLYVAFFVTALLMTKDKDIFAMLAFLFGSGALVAAIITAVTLLKFRLVIED